MRSRLGRIRVCLNLYDRAPTTGEFEDEIGTIAGDEPKLGLSAGSPKPDYFRMLADPFFENLVIGTFSAGTVLSSNLEFVFSNSGFLPKGSSCRGRNLLWERCVH